MSKKILILGINGFIGSHLTDNILANTDWQIVGMDLATHNISSHLQNSRLHFMNGDITKNHAWIETQIKNCDAVLPLAAIAGRARVSRSTTATKTISTTRFRYQISSTHAKRFLSDEHDRHGAGGHAVAVAGVIAAQPVGDGTPESIDLDAHADLVLALCRRAVISGVDAVNVQHLQGEIERIAGGSSAHDTHQVLAVAGSGLDEQ